MQEITKFLQVVVQAVHFFCPLLPNRNVRLGLRQNFNFYSANLSLAKWANCDSALYCANLIIASFVVSMSAQKTSNGWPVPKCLYRRKIPAQGGAMTHLAIWHMVL